MKRLLKSVIFLCLFFVGILYIHAEEGMIYWAVDGSNCEQSTGNCVLKISNNEISGSHYSNGILGSDEIPWTNYHGLVSASVGAESDMVKPSNTSHWFYGLEKLESVDLTYLDTSNVIDMSYMFADTVHLQLVDLRSFDTSNVINMMSMFEQTVIEVIVISDKSDTSKVTSSTNMFNGSNRIGGMNGTVYNSDKVDKELARLDTNNQVGYFFDYVPIPFYYKMFGTNCDKNNKNCTLKISNSEISGDAYVGGISYGLYPTWYDKRSWVSDVVVGGENDIIRPVSTYSWFNGIKAKSIDLTYLDTRNTVSMTNMFYYDSSLEVIKVGSLWDTSKVIYSKNMFYNCENLMGEKGTNYNSSYINKEYARVDNSNENGYFWSSMPSKIYWALDNNTLKLSNNEFTGSFTASGFTYFTSTWNNYSHLIENAIVGGENDIIRPYSTYRWFYGTKVVTLDLTYLDTSNVLNMSYMFGSANELQIIKVGNLWDTSKVTKSLYMFLSNYKIFGMNGAIYDDEKTDVNYANVGDNGYLWNSIPSTINWAIDGSNCLSSNNDCTLRISNNEITGSHYASGITYSYPVWNNYDTSINNVIVGSENDIIKPYITSSWFSNITKIDLIDLTYLDTSRVNNKTNMFYNDVNLQIIKVSDLWDKNNILNIDNITYNCNSLLSISNDTYGFLWDTIPTKFNWYVIGNNCDYYNSNCTLKITNNELIGDSFESGSTYSYPSWPYSSSIHRVELGGENDIISTYSTSKWFKDMSNLKSLDLTYLDTSNTTNMSQMFQNTYNLEIIKVGNLWTTTNVIKSSDMFFQANHLIGENGTAYNAEHVSSEYAKIDTKNNPGYFWSSIPGEIYWAIEGENCNSTYNCTLKISGKVILGDYYQIGTAYTYPTWIGYSSYYNRIVVGGEDDIVRPYTTTRWFQDINNIEVLDLTYLDTSRVTNMDYMFQSMDNLEIIKVGNLWSTSNVTSSIEMFSGDFKLQGENGMAYDYNHYDKEYARIDTNSSPGYLSTSVPNKMYWAVDGDNCSYNYYTSSYNCSLTISNNTISGDHYASGTFYKYPKWKEYSQSIRSIQIGNENDIIKPSSTKEWFYGINRIDVIDLTYLDTSDTKNMSEMFFGTENLEIIKVGNLWSTENVVYDVNMFVSNYLSGMNGTAYNDSNHGKTYAVVDSDSTPGYLWTYIPDKMYYAMMNCSNNYNQDCTLKISNNNIDYNGNSNYQVGEFYVYPKWQRNTYYYSVHYVELGSENDIIRPNSMRKWFSSMNNLRSIDLTYLDTSKIKNTEQMFYGDYNLSEIDVPENWAMSNVIHSDNMFNGCNNLVGIGGTKYDSNHVDIEYAVIDDESHTGYLTNADYVLYWAADDEGTLKISNYEISGNYRFSGTTHSRSSWRDQINNYQLNLSSISEVIVGGENDIIRPYDTSNWFKNMYSLEHIDLTYLDTSRVKNMSEMFAYDTSLEYVKVSDKWNTSKVVNSNGMFIDCYHLIGMNSTTFDYSHTDKEYARVDTPNGAGYFWNINPQTLYWGLYNCDNYNNNCTLKISSKPLEDSNNYYVTDKSLGLPKWLGYSGNINNVIIGGKNDIIKPHTTVNWFRGLINVNSLDLTYLDTSNVADMSGMFERCHILKNINLSKLNTSKVIKMSRMFYEAPYVESFDFSKFDTSKVKNMDEMFSRSDDFSSYNPYVPKSIDISSFDTSSVTNMSKMFAGQASLQVIKVGNKWNTSKVTNSNGMFKGCSSLAGKTNFFYDNSKTNHNYAKVGDNGYLWDLIPNKIYWESVYDEKMCANKLIISSNEIGTNNQKRDYFYPVGHGTPYFVNDNSTYYKIEVGGENDIIKPYSMYGWFSGNYFKYIDLTNVDTSLLLDTGRMFSGSNNLMIIKVSDNWDTSRVKYSTNMFNGCTNLIGMNGTTYDEKKVDKTYARIDSTNSGYLWNKIPNIYWAVDGSECNSGGICTLTISNNTIDGNHYDDGSFNYVTYDTNTSLPWYSYAGSIRSVKLGGPNDIIKPLYTNNWFNNMYYLTSIDLQYLDTSNVLNMAYMFAYSSRLQSLDLSNFKTSKVTDMSGMFAGLNQLTTLDLSGFDTSKVNLISNLFQYDSELQIIKVGSKWDISKVSMAYNLFDGCNSLVGMNGTKYSPKNDDKTYARLDTKDNPGYFSDKIDTSKIEIKIPRTLSIVESKANEVKLVWDLDVYAKGYNVYRSEYYDRKYTKIASTTKTTYTDTSGKHGFGYYYKIKAYNDSGEGKESNIEYKQILPNNVENIRITKIGQKNVTISWNKDDVTKFEMNFGTSKKKAKEIYLNKKYSYTNKKLKPNTTYYFRIRGHRNGYSGKWSQYLVFKTAPKNTKISSVKVNTFNSLKVNIKSVSGATKYIIERSTNKKKGFVKVGETTSLSYIDNNLTTNKTYYYRVKACNEYDACSGYTKVVKGKPVLTKPSLSLKTPDKKVVTITINKTNDAEGYELYRSTNKKKYTLVPLEDNSLIVNDITKSKKKYYYKVRSYKIINGKKVYSSYSKVKNIKSK